jgi:hypothetical protein
MLSSVAPANHAFETSVEDACRAAGDLEIVASVSTSAALVRGATIEARRTGA